jgi:hypothetical protein
LVEAARQPIFVVNTNTSVNVVAIKVTGRAWATLNPLTKLEPIL